MLVAAELIASSMAPGLLLMGSQDTGRTDVPLLAIVLPTLLGKATDAVLGAVEGRGQEMDVTARSGVVRREVLRLPWSPYDRA
ncbi:hypothetical protein [Streptomyces sp. NPDC008125]|uniref:hypothetical protein n=1 Tax=Streptomyces sp. NPDC008125 TaxID=3364811 RepID=UPI0036EF5A80